MIWVHVGLYKNINMGLCPECVTTMTKLENIMVNPHKNKCVYKNLYRNITDNTKHLRMFGGMEVAFSIISTKTNLKYQIMTCIFLGYT